MERPLLDFYPDAIICVCMEVTEQEIRNAIAQGHDSFELLSKQLLVGTGCSSCVDEIKAILKEIKNKKN